MSTIKCRTADASAGEKAWGQLLVREGKKSVKVKSEEQRTRPEFRLQPFIPRGEMRPGIKP